MRPPKPYISNNYLDFLGEFEAIFETALTNESGPGLRESHKKKFAKTAYAVSLLPAPIFCSVGGGKGYLLTYYFMNHIFIEIPACLKMKN
jgi:hypothetical protein